MRTTPVSLLWSAVVRVPGPPPWPHLVYEDVERLLQSHSVPAAHGQEAEAHAHVEPLADPAAHGKALLRLLGALRSTTCTTQGDDDDDDVDEGLDIVPKLQPS